MDYEQDLKVYLKNLKRGKAKHYKTTNHSADFMEYVTSKSFDSQAPLGQRMYASRWALPKHLWQEFWLEWPSGSAMYLSDDLVALRERIMTNGAKPKAVVAEVSKPSPTPRPAVTIEYTQPSQRPSLTIPLPTLGQLGMFAGAALTFAAGVGVGLVA